MNFSVCRVAMFPINQLRPADFTDDGVIVASNFPEDASFHTPKAAYSEQASMIDDDATPIAPSNFAQMTTPVDSAPIDSSPIDSTPVAVDVSEAIAEPVEWMAPEPVHEQTISEPVPVPQESFAEAPIEVQQLEIEETITEAATEPVAPEAEAVVPVAPAPIQPVFQRPANLRSSWGKAVNKTFAAPAPAVAIKSVKTSENDESSKRRKMSIDAAPVSVTSTVNTTTSSTSSTFATEFIRTRSTKPLTEPQEFHFHTDDVVRKRKMQMIQDAIKESKQTRTHITKTESGDIQITKSKSTISNAVSRVRWIYRFVMCIDLF